MNEFKTVKDALKMSEDINNDTLDALKGPKNKILHGPEEENLTIKPEEVNILDPNTQENDTCKINDKPEIYLEEPELVKTIYCPGNQEWEMPWNISSIDDDSVLISDWGKDFITMAYNSNKPPVKIPAQIGCLRDACLFKDSLYTAYDKFITKRTFNNGKPGPEVVYHPKIDNIVSIKVLNESCVLLLSYCEKKITEFNLSNNQTKILVSNLKNPVHVNIMKSKGEVKYLVTCQETHSIDVYDEGWKLVHTFGGYGEADGQMKDPEGTALTKQGILVAEETKSQINLYSTEGKFIRHILRREDGISDPVGLSFTTPFLWLSHCNPPYVECYKICQ